MRNIFLTIVYALALCFVSPACGQEVFDANVYLEQDSLNGTWVQYLEKASAIPGLYSKDSCFYRIDTDSLPEVIVQWRYFKTFFKIYPSGGFEKGFVYSKVDPEDYDYANNISFLKYSLIVYKLNETVQTTIKFWMPAPDSLTIQIGGDRPIGVRRQWR